MIKTRLRRGALIRVFACVYRFSGVPQSWKQKVLSVSLWGGDTAVVSHGTAAKLWRFAISPTHIEITMPHKKEPPRPGIRVHRGLVHSRVSIDGIPVTTPARTLLDVGPRVSVDVLESMVDDAITRKLTTRAGLEWELTLSGGRGRYGSKALRGAIAHLSDGHCESPLENRVLRLLIKEGLPLPTRQHEIRADGFVARVDLAYPQAKLAIEIDGFRYHSSHRAFDADRRRDARLQTLGWQVLRVTDRMFDEPRYFLNAVKARLRASLF